MASATLTTHGEFNYLCNTLSADEVDTLFLGSPFDYESSTLLYVANDMPEPNAPGYQQALDRAIISTAKATGGRMLVLFTSYAALKKTAQAITGPLAREDIFVFEQGEGASPNALLESFKTTDRAVLLGTRSFWEGVDVPGEFIVRGRHHQTPFWRAHRPDHRGPLRAVRGLVQRILSARIYLEIPSGIWTPDPHCI